MFEGCTKVMFANTERFCSLLLWKQVAKHVFNLSVGHIEQNLIAVTMAVHLSSLYTMLLSRVTKKQQGPFEQEGTVHLLNTE